MVLQRSVWMLRKQGKAALVPLQLPFPEAECKKVIRKERGAVPKEGGIHNPEPEHDEEQRKGLGRNGAFQYTGADTLEAVRTDTVLRASCFDKLSKLSRLSTNGIKTPFALSLSKGGP